MRTRLFLLYVFIAVTVCTNVRAAGNIVHGVSVVVIDAGHGGKFPGAHYGGVYEKDLTLKIALKLGALIEEEMPGVKVVYTRKTDKTLGVDLASDLQARADIANKANGDLFISIHVNAARSTSARGVETLIMGETPKEQIYNEGALYENNREDLIDMSDQRTAAIVRAYIQNLQFTYGEYSMAMARCIQSNYEKTGRQLRKIKPQLLRVLYATDMPGVLTEIGFMSNSSEMAYMRSEKGQNQIARSLLLAVKDYSACVLGSRGGDAAVQTPKAETARPAPAEEPADSISESSPEIGKTAPSQTADVPSAAKPDEKPDPERPTAGEKAAVSAEKPLRYAIQVVASTKAVSLSAPEFKTYRNKVKQYSAEGMFRYKYCVGECNDQASAQQKLKEVRRIFPQAFVVKCRGTQIVK